MRTCPDTRTYNSWLKSPSDMIASPGRKCCSSICEVSTRSCSSVMPLKRDTRLRKSILSVVESMAASVLSPHPLGEGFNGGEGLALELKDPHPCPLPKGEGASVQCCTPHDDGP